jgi:hypothetical protein
MNVEPGVRAVSGMGRAGLKAAACSYRILACGYGSGTWHSLLLLVLSDCALFCRNNELL